MERRHVRHLVAHTEVERYLGRFGYSPERIRELLRSLPDPVDLDRVQKALAKHGITPHDLMDRMGGSP